MAQLLYLASLKSDPLNHGMQQARISKKNVPLIRKLQ